MAISIQGPSVSQQIRDRTSGQESAHWYRGDGTPAHRQESGRSTTLREARKEKKEHGVGLYPSVTTIMGILDKPGLGKWKIRETLRAAWDCRQFTGTLDEWLDIVVAKSSEKSGTAMNFGTRFHEAAWQHNTGRPVTCDDEVRPYYERYALWFEQRVDKVLEAEQVVVSRLGFAGTRDAVFKMDGKVVVVDFKTQSVDARYGPRAWPEHILQLAAYRSVRRPGADCMNLIINSVEPTAPHEHWWKPEQTKSAYREFKLCLKLWQARKKYHPSR